MRRTDLLFHAGGECVQQYGGLVRKTVPDEDNGYTFTGSTVGATSNNGDAISTASSSVPVPRIHYEGGVPYLLSEASRTNKLLRSAAFDHATWTKSNASVTANAATGPDGAANADKLIPDTSNATHRVNQDVTGMTAGQTYSFSVYAKIGEYRYLGLRVDETADTANNFQASFDLSDGTLEVSGAGGTSSFDGSYVEDMGDGWYRCVITGQVENSATAVTARVYALNAAATLPGSSAFVGDGSSGIYVWGAQLENSAKAATSYIPTTSATVTRAAETIHAPASFPTQDITVYAKFRERDLGLNYVFHRGSTTTTADPRLRVTGLVTGYTAQWDDGTTQVSKSTATGLVALDDLVELRVAINPTGTVTIGVVANGGAETITTSTASATPGAAFAGDKMYFGNGPSSPGNRPLSSFKVARGVRTMAEMRGL